MRGSIVALLLASVAMSLASVGPVSVEGLGSEGMMGNYYTDGYQPQGMGQRTWNYVDFKTWPESCRTGVRQSPISFVNVDPNEVVTDAKLRRLKFSSGCTFGRERTKMDIVNDGNIINVMFETEDTIPGDLSPCTVEDPVEKGEPYHFLRMHFHANSEHKFRNIVPDVEMHLVFGTDATDGNAQRLMQIAVLLKASSTINSTSVRALRHILVEGSLPLPRTKTTCFLTEDLPLLSFLPSQENYLAYDGSNTFPPCRENVRWVVMTSPIVISRLALGKLRNVMDETMPNDFHRFGNARPPQPLNNRRIYRYVDNTKKSAVDSSAHDVWKRNDPKVVAVFPANLQVGLLATEGVRTGSLATEAAGSDVGEDIRGAAMPDDRQARKATMRKAGDNAAEGEKRDRNVTVGQDANAADSSDEGVDSIDGKADDPPITPITPLPVATEASTTQEPGSTSAAPMPTVPTEELPSTESKDIKGSNRNKTERMTGSSSSMTPRSLNTSANNVTSGDAPTVADRISKAVVVGRMYLDRATRYVAKYPMRIAVLVILLLLVTFTIVACFRAWRRPAYVAGVRPDELEPLTGNPKHGYGTAAHVVPPMP